MACYSKKPTQTKTVTENRHAILWVDSCLYAIKRKDGLKAIELIYWRQKNSVVMILKYHQQIDAQSIHVRPKIRKRSANQLNLNTYIILKNLNFPMTNIV